MLIPDLVERAGGLEPAVERILAALDESFLVDGLPLHVEASIGIASYPSARQRRRHPPAARRRRDVPRQAEGRHPRPVHPGARPPRQRQPDAAVRAAAGDPRARARASTISRRSTHESGRLAGVEALVRWQHPDARPDRPGRVHSGCRTDGADRAADAFRPRRGARPVQALAGRGPDRQRRRQPLDAQPARPDACPSQIATAPPQVGASRATASPWRSPRARSPPTRSGRRPSSSSCSGLGVSIAIDDFGIGYTSLAHLARLAIDQIKIDRSFVTNMTADSHDAAIVRSIITLGHDLGLKVTGEGVETQGGLRQADEPRLRPDPGLSRRPPRSRRRHHPSAPADGQHGARPRRKLSVSGARRQPAESGTRGRGASTNEASSPTGTRF